MNRYDMTTEYNKYACEDTVVPVQSEFGEWIKFTDHVASLAAHQQAAEPVALADARAAMERAKKLPIWDNINHALHVELDVIFKALAAPAIQQPQNSATHHPQAGSPLAAQEVALAEFKDGIHRLVMRHIDRMNDVAPEDTADQIIASFVKGFDALYDAYLPAREAEIIAQRAAPTSCTGNDESDLPG